MTAPFPTELAVVKTGSMAGEIVKVLGEGNVWDYSVEDANGEHFRLDPEQLAPLRTSALWVLAMMTPAHVRKAIAALGDAE